jgi:hypothetical protein
MVEARTNTCDSLARTFQKVSWFLDCVGLAREHHAPLTQTQANYLAVTGHYCLVRPKHTKFTWPSETSADELA